MEAKEVRLNKFLASCGIASRRKADEIIAEGRIKVNSKMVKNLGTKINPNQDKVYLDNQRVTREEKLIYIAFNKPKDCITTSQDTSNRKTVLTFVKVKERVFPIGRLDRNTTGTLILTNDGDLANKLTHPNFKVKKTYLVESKNPVSELDFAKLMKGVQLEDGKTLPCSGVILNAARTLFELTLKEGRNRQIRRMFEVIGNEVTALDRISFAGITHRGLKRATWRILRAHEVRQLKDITKKKIKSE
ncbi:MAG: rRNA pseudouridine synthase [Calditrichaeota bacterium]|nr:MAG: rRNA pseudouridine synthase [Calditrichota bacterium]